MWAGQAELARRLALQVDLSAQLGLLLDAAQEDPSSEALVDKIKGLLDVCEDEGLLAETFIFCLQTRLGGRTRMELEEDYYEVLGTRPETTMRYCTRAMGRLAVCSSCVSALCCACVVFCRVHVLEL